MGHRVVCKESGVVALGIFVVNSRRTIVVGHYIEVIIASEFGANINLARVAFPDSIDLVKNQYHDVFKRRFDTVHHVIDPNRQSYPLF